MADGLDDDRLTLKPSRHASVIPGLVIIALGLLALAIASVEFLVFSGIAGAANRGDGPFGLSFGTTAYIAGYAGAGVTLIVIGAWKIYRTRCAF